MENTLYNVWVRMRISGGMGMAKTVSVNPMIVTETIETSDVVEMTFNRYYVKTDSVFELQKEY